MSVKSSTTGEITKLNTGKYKAQTGGQVLEDFFENKLSPMASVVNDVFLRGEDFNHETPTIGGELKNLAMPLPWANAQELLTQPNAAPFLVGMIADGLGIGVNTYRPERGIRSVSVPGKEELVRLPPEDRKTLNAEVEQKIEAAKASPTFFSLPTQKAKDAAILKIVRDARRAQTDSIRNVIANQPSLP
jgi:hypothetical protein